MFRRFALAGLLLTGLPVLGLPILGLTSTAWAQGLDEDRLLEIVEENVQRQRRNSLDQMFTATTREDRSAAREIGRLLDSRQVTVNFQEVPFEDCLDFLRDVTGLNIVLSMGAAELLEDEARDIRLRLRDVRLRSCLELLLRLENPELRYGVRHGVLVIGLVEEFAEDFVLELYDVSDLVHSPPDFPAPRIGLEGLDEDGR
jgi:hypothetical protein